MKRNPTTHKIKLQTKSNASGGVPTGEVIHLNEPEIKQQLGERVRKSVEETLNVLPDAEADEITQAYKYERTAASYHRIYR